MKLHCVAASRIDNKQFITEQTVRRGIEFQLGIWMHGYRWPDKPPVQNMISGLTGDTHGPYCRDALATILQRCPAISAVALRRKPPIFRLEEPEVQGVAQAIHFVLDIAQALVGRPKLSIFDVQRSVVVFQFVERL